MNWYKKIKAQVGVIEDVGTKPPDIIDDNDDGDDGDWEDCYQAIQQWVRANLNKDPLLTIQKQLIENTAIHTFQQGVHPETMVWHGESLDFFRDESFRAATIGAKFMAFNGLPPGDFSEEPYFDLNTMKGSWKGMLQSSNLLHVIKGAGCQAPMFIEDPLYDFVLGEIMNGMYQQNKHLAETFQTYLENNIKKMEKEIIQDIAMGSGLTQFCEYNYLWEMRLGKVIDYGHNINGVRVHSYDDRFDQIGIVFQPEITLDIDVPDWLSEKVLKEHGEYGDGEEEE